MMKGFLRCDHMRNFLLGILLVTGVLSAHGQTKDSLYTVSGMIRDQRNLPVSMAMIINMRTQEGIFGNTNGTFSVKCLPADTLMITSFGFLRRPVYLSDTAVWDISQTLNIYLEERTYRLSTVQIFGQRDLQKIQEDIAKLGYNEDDYKISGIDALQSPITFLYQEFSKKERSKRAVAEMENEDKKRDLLKELFRIYVDYDILDLSNEEFDDFIAFINVSDEYMKTVSQYDFLLFVKDRFQDYRIYIRRQRLNNTDYNYDQD
ncbi:MAG: hypothetical protein RL220_1272 [Bacteroidota bacterium]